MNYFKKFLDDDDFIYSLDMIRLNIDFGSNTKVFMKYMQSLSELNADVDINYYPSFKPYTYRHLWDIVISDDVRFAIGLDIGLANSKNKGFIEFNPNKCENNDIFNSIKEYIFDLTERRILVRYDFAIDIPLDRSDVKLIREKGKIYNFLVKDDGITEYLGVRSHSGFIKVYDKRAESKLDYSLTRVEITLDRSTDIFKVFPKVLLYDSQYKLELDDSFSSTQRTLIQMFRQCENPNWFWSDLRHELKKKIEPHLADKVLSLNKDCALNVKSLALSYEK